MQVIYYLGTNHSLRCYSSRSLSRISSTVGSLSQLTVPELSNAQCQKHVAMTQNRGLPTADWPCSYSARRLRGGLLLMITDMQGLVWHILVSAGLKDYTRALHVIRTWSTPPSLVFHYHTRLTPSFVPGTMVPKPPPPAYDPIAIDRHLYEAIAKTAETQGQRSRVQSFTIPIRSGKAWEVKAGQVCRILTPEGPQVGDLNIWNRDNPRERFWAARTRQLQQSHVKVFDRLWSCLPYLRPLVTVTAVCHTT